MMLNATYFETTKTLTITSPCCDLAGDEPLTRITACVPSRYHLSATLKFHGLKLYKEPWKQIGNMYTAHLQKAA